MVQLIKQPTTQIVTKEGEVKISLEITLNVNTEGCISIVPQVITIPGEVNSVGKNKPQEDDWIIPSFKTDKIKFGKKAEE